MESESRRVTFFEVEEWEKEYFADGELPGLHVDMHTQRLDPDTAKRAEDSQVVSVFIYSQITADVLDRLPNLRLISTRSTGYDHIDLEECKDRGIAVSNVPFYGENTVAEHAFGLILSLSRKIYQAYVRTTKLDFSLKGLIGFDLKGKTIGVVGAGRIGLHVVRIAKGFGMEVLVYDVRQEPLLAEVLGFRYVSIEELLGSSDVITLHVPLNKHTHHMINMDNISLIKPGAILINTSRGAIVQTEALVKALDECIICGAGLDVFEGEDAIKEETQVLVQRLPEERMKDVLLSYSLLHRDNVVITPHIAFYSEEALQRIMETTKDNILRFFEGRPSNLVTS